MREMTAEEAKNIVVGNEFLIYAVRSGLPLEEAEKTWEQATRIVDELVIYWNTDRAELDSIDQMLANEVGSAEYNKARERMHRETAALDRCAKRLKLLTSGQDPKESGENLVSRKAAE